MFPPEPTPRNPDVSEGRFSVPIEARVVDEFAYDE